ncbi:Uncharacterised protein [Mycobacterium tuberculosis]|nr:Uncharacterised protein [Mycobacterium tuberculosis]
MSEHHTGALDSCGRPRTTAWCPSVRASAPSRIISSTKRNRASNTFSVIIDVPSAIDAKAIAIGCRSVGNPGNGKVATLTAFGRSYWVTRKLASVWVTVAPASCNLCSTSCRCAGSTPATDISPRVIAAAMPHVAATIRSPITRCSVGCSRGTPVMVIVGEPAPSTCAPIWFNIVHKSTTSGSRAAL